MKLLKLLRTIVIVVAFLSASLVAPNTNVTRAAGPWFVAPAGADSSDCLTPATACATINGAIGKATSGDTILVASGTYTATTGAEVVLINQTSTLLGGWDSTFSTQTGYSTIDARGQRVGMTILNYGPPNPNVVATVDHFVVQNGATAGNYGAGIGNRGKLILTNSIVRDNVASGVGAGGGIYNASTLVVTNSLISNNLSLGTAGGGILNQWSASIDSSAIISNYSGYNGGGISVSGNAATLALNNSTISGNSAGYGGGIALYNSDPYLSLALSINSSTIASNSASTNSGGILFAYGRASLQNSIVADNEAPAAPECGFTGGAVINSSGYNLFSDSQDCPFAVVTDVVNVDPRLGPLTGSVGYLPLLPGSPAINAANPAGCTDNSGNLLATDQRGVPRPQGGRCDIGAYETRAPTLDSLSPAAAFAGGPAFGLVLTGTNFADGATVLWNDNSLSSTFVSSTTLTASVTINQLAVGGFVPVQVQNPGPDPGDGLTTGVQTVTVTYPAPTFDALAPISTSADTPSLDLVLTGTGFFAGTQALWNGDSISTTFLDSSQLKATIPASKLLYAGMVTLTLVNPVPNLGPSNGQAFTITLAPQTLNFGELVNKTLGMPPISITATASSGLPVSFNSRTAGVCTVTNAKVTLVSGGVCTIRASQAGNATYAAVDNVDRSFNVFLPQTITFNPLPNLSLRNGPFNVSANATSGLVVTFSSLSPSACTVSGTTVTLGAGGTCTIRASQAGDSTYAAADNVDRSFEVFGHILFLPVSMSGSA